MTPRNEVHVVPASNEIFGLDYRWTVESAMPGAYQTHHVTQAQAFEVGRARAKKLKAELFIHGRNGQIRLRSSFGHDPKSRKG